MQTLNMLSQVVSMNLEELAIIGTTLTSIVASTTYLATKHFTEKKHRTRRKSPMERTGITGWFNYSDKHLNFLYKLIEFKAETITNRNIQNLFRGTTNKVKLSKEVIKEVELSMSPTYKLLVYEYIAIDRLPLFIQEHSLIVIDEIVDNFSTGVGDVINVVSSEKQKNKKQQNTNHRGV